MKRISFKYKRIFAVFMAVAILTASIPFAVHAETITDTYNGIEYTWSSDAANLTITKKTSGDLTASDISDSSAPWYTYFSTVGLLQIAAVDGKVTIPSNIGTLAANVEMISIDDANEVEFESNCFNNHQIIDSILVKSATAMIIGEKAFQNSSITTFRANCKDVTAQASAFFSCSSLTQFSNFYDYTTSSDIDDPSDYIFKVENSAFYGCTSLEKLVFKNDDCSIFQNNGTIDDNVEIYGYMNGNYQSAYTYHENFPSKKFIAFCNDGTTNHSFETTTEGNHQTIIKKCSVCEYISLEEVDHIEGTCGDDVKWRIDKGSDTLTISGSGAIIDSAAGSYPSYRKHVNNLMLTKTVVGEGVTRLGNYAFSSSTWGLKEGITLPESLESIGNNCFYYNKQIKEITIPKNVTEIGTLAFESCTNLATVSILNPTLDKMYITRVTDDMDNPITKMYGLANSTAQAYAKENNIEFVIVCSDGTENHSFTNYVSDGNATCTADGTKTAVCDNGCGETDTIADEGSALNHSFTNYVSDDNATCTSNATETAECDNGCGETDTREIPDSMLEHAYEKVVIEPTCTEGGCVKYVCIHCGDTLVTENTDPLGHDFKEYASNSNATCTKDGTKTAVCERDGCDATDTVIDEGTAFGHDFSDNAEYCRNGCGEKSPDYQPPEPEEYSGKTETDYEYYRIVPCYNQIKVAWSHDTELEGYEIYISRSRNDGFEKIKEVKTDEASYYLINNLQSKTIYYVYIIGYTSFNGERINMVQSSTRAIMVK